MASQARCTPLGPVHNFLLQQATGCSHAASDERDMAAAAGPSGAVGCTARMQCGVLDCLRSIQQVEVVKHCIC
jgi:hypothetical protein